MSKLRRLAASTTQFYEELLHSPALREPDNAESQSARKPSARFRNNRGIDSIGVHRDGSIDRHGSAIDGGSAVNGDALVGKDISVKHAADAKGG